MLTMHEQPVMQTPPGYMGTGDGLYASAAPSGGESGFQLLPWTWTIIGAAALTLLFIRQRPPNDPGPRPPSPS